MAEVTTPFVHDSQPEPGILLLRLQRPERKNALNLAMYQRLAHCLQQAMGDDDIRVIVVTGSDECFTSGNDLGDFAKTSGMSDDDNPLFAFMRALLDCEKPVIAAVNGPAIGIGTTALLHCDLIFAHPCSEFKLPFVGLGLCPEFASSWLLPHWVGYAKASEWLLTGKTFGAPEAMQAGLLSDVVEHPLDEAFERARRLVALPPKALKVTKSLLRGPMRESVDAAMSAEIAHFSEALRGPEFAEAAEAFFAKRRPDFSSFKP